MWKFAKATLHTQRIYENMVLISSHYSTCCLRLSWSPLGVLRRLGVFLSLKRIPKRRTKVCFWLSKVCFAFFLMLHFLWLCFFLGGFVNDTVVFDQDCICSLHTAMLLPHSCDPSSLAGDREPSPRGLRIGERGSTSSTRTLLETWTVGMDHHVLARLDGCTRKKIKARHQQNSILQLVADENSFPMNLDFGYLFFCSHLFRDFGWLPGHVGICCRTYASEAELNLTKFLMSRYIVGECVFCPNLLDIFLYNFLKIFC